MARFDVYKYNSTSVPLVLDVQADLLKDLKTCVVIPLVPEAKAKEEALPRLKPLITVKEQTYILMTTDVSTVTRSSLGECIANVGELHRQDIIEALDFLFQGF
jgi:toxin CcdB